MNHTDFSLGMPFRRQAGVVAGPGIRQSVGAVANGEPGIGCLSVQVPVGRGGVSGTVANPVITCE
jgi:hypothetical protein